MKKLILIITTALMFTACHVGGVREPRNAEDEPINAWRTVTYDGHEYVKVIDRYSTGITHKPNCTFCEKKQQ